MWKLIVHTASDIFILWFESSSHLDENLLSGKIGFQVETIRQMNNTIPHQLWMLPWQLILRLNRFVKMEDNSYVEICTSLISVMAENNICLMVEIPLL